MGAVICTSEKAAAPLNELPGSKHPTKSLRRKITKDSIYDSSDFIECSSLIHSSGKEKVKRKIIPDGQNENAAKSEEMEFTLAAADATRNESSPHQNVEFSKYSSSQNFFKNVWNRKHKTYSSVSTQCVRRLSWDNHRFEKTDKPLCDTDNPTIPVTKESVAQQTDSEVLGKDSSTASSCFDHLTSFLSFDGKCGLCDFVHSGEHYRWDSLEDDAVTFKEISKSIGKWLHSTPNFMDKIILQKTESCQKVRIILRRDRNGVQEILVTDGSTSYQIQGKQFSYLLMGCSSNIGTVCFYKRKPSSQMSAV